MHSAVNLPEQRFVFLRKWHREFHRKWAYPNATSCVNLKGWHSFSMIPEGTMNAHRRNGVQALLGIDYRRKSKGGIVRIHYHSVIIALVSLCLAAPGQVGAQSHQDSGPGMNQT